ncbi:MAG TPA: hypothetical protein PLE30_04245 [Candidatus Kapabacteria bacterium]|nr:hypothetical protein [Candidatus Kapabacteria bacterium]
MFRNYIYIGAIFFLFLIACTSIKKTFIQSNYPEIMKMEGSYEQFSQDSSRFTLEATRLTVVDDEYIPSSENFVVKVYNSDMVEMYNSSTNKDFFMVIGEVEPKNINDTKIYTFDWNLKDSYGRNFKNGKYLATLEIPAKPNRYICNIEFEIK